MPENRKFFNDHKNWMPTLIQNLGGGYEVFALMNPSNAQEHYWLVKGDRQIDVVHGSFPYQKALKGFREKLHKMGIKL